MRPHIGIFGRTNVGKSSFLNAITKQSISIVSEQAGTTTDAVNKIIEFGEAGPVVFIDTAGLDDKTQLGEKRVASTLEIIKKVDLGLIIIVDNIFDDFEKNLIGEFRKYNTPFFCIHNKSDLSLITKELKQNILIEYNCDAIDFSSIKSNKSDVDNLITLINQYIPESAFNNPSIIGDLVKYGDHVLLVTPIDIEAPKGRIILPQVQTIRDALDNDCMTTILKERELDIYFNSSYPKPALVITDSQVFLKVNSSVPMDIPMTSFSILFARLKGDFNKYIEGVEAISKLQDGNKILILESCSHHVSCDDIGRIKIPRWINNFTGKKLSYDVVASFNKVPSPINEYSLVIQCGGCMLTRKQIINKLLPAIELGIPVTNYGMAIAYTMGIFNRAIAPFYKLNNPTVNVL